MDRKAFVLEQFMKQIDSFEDVYIIGKKVDTSVTKYGIFSAIGSDQDLVEKLIETLNG